MNYFRHCFKGMYLGALCALAVATATIIVATTFSIVEIIWGIFR